MSSPTPNTAPTATPLRLLNPSSLDSREPRRPTTIPPANKQGTAAAALFFLPLVFRWVLPVSTELTLSFYLYGVSFPIVDFVYLLLPFISWRAYGTRVQFLLGWGLALLLWSIGISAWRDSQFDFSCLVAALDSYFPIILIVLVRLTPSNGKVLKIPLLAVLIYMSVQIVLYASGILTWDAAIGQRIEGTTMLRIYTTMGAATGSALTVAMILALYWALSTSRDRLGRSIAATCALVSMILLLSRGPLLLVAVAVILRALADPASLGRWFIRFCTAPRLAAVVLVVLAALVSLTYVGTGLAGRFESLYTDDADIRTGGRLGFWQRAFDAHGDAGYLGRGVNNIDPRGRLNLNRSFEWNAVSHNAYLMVWYETGAIGLALFTGMLLHWILREIRRLRKQFSFWFVVAYVTVGLMTESCVLSLEYMVLALSIMSVLSNTRVSAPPPGASRSGTQQSTYSHRVPWHPYVAPSR